ncbi:MAG: translation initiation factor IF-2 [Planctomycetota bacterium]
MRLYELAKALNLNSKGLITLCSDLGEPVKNHMSIVSEATWNKLQDRCKVPPEKRIPYQVEPPKKKVAAPKKATSVTAKSRKEAKDAESKAEAELQEKSPPSPSSTAVPPASAQTPAPSTKPSRSPSPVAPAAPAAKDGHKPKSSEPSQPSHETKLIKKGVEVAAASVLEEQPVSHIERVRLQAQDSQVQKDEEVGGLVRTSSSANRATARQAMQNRVASRRGKRRRHHQELIKIENLTVKLPITVKQLSSEMKIRSNEIINRLKHHDGTEVGPEDYLTEDHLITLGLLFEIEIIVEGETDRVTEILDSHIEEGEKEDAALRVKPRPPVVAVMGHVDHGKTSLLDFIRKSRVAAREAGGITQHIGAYQVEHKGKKITFIDTPGHQVFTEMRARGARSTDIVILVVAADDGVMPQTIESIQHAKAAKVPLIVAINKMDKPGANIDKIRQQLTQYELVSEEWGGTTIFCPVSAITGQGIDHLLEMILLQAEILELKANPELSKAMGIVLESELSTQKGVVATLLVQNGTLRQGDIVVCGSAYGKIRALVDENSKMIKEAPPSKPVQVFGLSEPPEVASKFHVTPDMASAREVAELRRKQSQIITQKSTPDTALSVDDLFEAMEASDKDALSLVVKADVRGSLEAIVGALEKLGAAGPVPLKIVGKSVGGISESDVLLAKASSAQILGFNVVADPKAMKSSKSNKVDIKFYKIIYELLDDVKAILDGRIGTLQQEQEIGQALVRAVFKSSKYGSICGCMVTDGIVRRGCQVRVSRNGVVIHNGVVETLRRFKDDVKEVKEGLECGMRVEDYDDIKEGDSIHFFQLVEVKQTAS